MKGLHLNFHICIFKPCLRFPLLGFVNPKWNPVPTFLSGVTELCSEMFFIVWGSKLEWKDWEETLRLHCHASAYRCPPCSRVVQAAVVAILQAAGVRHTRSIVDFKPVRVVGHSAAAELQTRECLSVVQHHSESAGHWLALNKIRKIGLPPALPSTATFPFAHISFASKIISKAT